jgi:hypothetical protein
VQSADSLVGVRGDYGERARYRTIRPLETFPEPCECHWLSADMAT